MGTKDPDVPDNEIAFGCPIENHAMFGLEDEAKGLAGTTLDRGDHKSHQTKAP